jgi:retron-type reverse transcriptase
MVLLPKIPGAVKVIDFRPICLQNCCIKIRVKLLTTRLQKEISALIDLNQTGFLKGRTISRNFVYAIELVQVCFKKTPTLVLKLDFAKAFDIVNWESLLTIMRVRGFNDTWCKWVL